MIWLFVKKITALTLLMVILSCFTAARGKYNRKKVVICKQELLIEIASTPKARAKGLMFRKHLAWNKGMLFVYTRPKILHFWMKNTYIDLDIGFFDENKILKVIKSMKKLDENIISSGIPAMYALEVNRGWFKKNNVNPGCRLNIL